MQNRKFSIFNIGMCLLVLEVHLCVCVCVCVCVCIVLYSLLTCADVI